MSTTTLTAGAPSSGRISVALDRDAADERDRQGGEEGAPVRQPVVDQRPGEIGTEGRHLALREVDHARRAVDDHERERQRPVDAAGGEAADDLLPELAHPALVAEVALADGVVGAQPRARAFDGDAADLEHVGAARGGERDAGVLLDDEDGEALGGVQAAEDGEDLADDERRQAERGLVEQQQPRPGEQGAAEREQLLLAAGEGARLLVAPVGELREELVDAGEVAGERVPARVAAEPQVLLDGQLDEGSAALGDVRDPEPRDRVGAGASAERTAAEDDRPLAADGAGDGAQRRRLAGAVGAEDGDDLALADLEADAVERLDGPVAGLDLVQLEQRAQRSRSRSRAIRPSSSPAARR